MLTYGFYYLAAFLLNLPFGRWRASYPTMSWQWIFFIHAPIPVLLLLRFLLSLNFGVGLIAASIGICIIAQRFGGKLKKD